MLMIERTNRSGSSHPHLFLFALLAACGSDESAGPGPGDPDAPAWSALPARPAPPIGDDDLVRAGAITVARGRVIAMVAEDATVRQVDDALRALDAELVASSPTTGRLTVALPDGADLAATFAAADALAADPAFSSASADLVGHDAVLPPAHDAELPGEYFPSQPQPDGSSIATGGVCDRRYDWRGGDHGANWDLQVIRAPPAWNLRDRVARTAAGPIAVGVIDSGFDRSHPEVSFDPKTPAGPAGAHGTMVASKIVGRHDRVGFEGVLPTGLVVGRVRRGQSATKSFEILEALLTGSGRDVRVVNLSQADFAVPDRDGRLWQLDDHIPDPDREGGSLKWTYGEALSDLGDTWNDELARLARDHRFLLTCAAGNAGDRGDVVYEARWSSGCNVAGLVHDNPRVLVVGSVDPPGRDESWFSSRDPHLYAPGACVPVAKDGGWVLTHGTSFAAPLVAGVAAWLWAIEPDATVAEVRGALLRSARDNPTLGSLPVLDAFGAILELRGDLLRRTTRSTILFDLADVDDGTVDGNLRVDHGGAVVTEIRTPDGRRGDGCVDLSDVRAFRDAWLIASGAGLPGAEPGDHPKRDLDEDGYVRGASTPAVEHAPFDEGRWSRFDLDGDQDVDPDDLAVLAGEWRRCRDGSFTPYGDDWEPRQLVSLLDSFDVHVPVALPQEHLVTVDVGVWSVQVPAGTVPPSWEDGYLLVTTGVTPAGLEVCVTSGSPRERKCRDIETRTVVAGQDLWLAPFEEPPPGECAAVEPGDPAPPDSRLAVAGQDLSCATDGDCDGRLVVRGGGLCAFPVCEEGRCVLDLAADGDACFVCATENCGSACAAYGECRAGLCVCASDPPSCEPRYDGYAESELGALSPGHCWQGCQSLRPVPRDPRPADVEAYLGCVCDQCAEAGRCAAARGHCESAAACVGGGLLASPLHECVALLALAPGPIAPAGADLCGVATRWCARCGAALGDACVDVIAATIAQDADEYREIGCQAASADCTCED